MAKSRSFKAKIEKQNRSQRYSGGNLPVSFVVDAGDVMEAGPVDGAFFQYRRNWHRTDVGIQQSRFGAGKLSIPACLVAILLQNASHVLNA